MDSLANDDDVAISLRESEKAKDILLSFSDDIARIRNKNDLLAFINRRLKELLPFHHGGIGIVNKSKGTYTALLFDPSAGIPNEPELDQYAKEGFPLNNVVKSVMATDRPVIFDLDDLTSSGKASLYTRLNYEAGMREMVLVALRNEEENFGFFGLFSENKHGFDTNHLKILQAVSSQLSIAVANILANDEILERENEKAMLLTLSNDISACRTYEDIQLRKSKTGNQHRELHKKSPNHLSA